jgi:hypothetical protein
MNLILARFGSKKKKTRQSTHLVVYLLKGIVSLDHGLEPFGNLLGDKVGSKIKFWIHVCGKYDGGK